MAGIIHGGELEKAIARFGGTRSDWIDLSTGINPNPYPVPTMEPDAWARLPERENEQRLLDAARRYYQVPSHAEIVAANGTQALIELLPNLGSEARVVIVSPTYGEHAHVWKKHGADITLVGGLDDIRDGSLAIVVNPNNPDCRVHEPETLCKLADRVDSLIVDEAFCDCAPEKSIVAKLPTNAIVLRSFGKFFGLAGMRLGFAICSPVNAEKLRANAGPWAVSSPALAIGAQALADENWRAQTQESLEESSQSLAKLLSQNAVEVLGINPLFVYARHKRAQELFEHLAQNQILVRCFPERPDYLRFGLCRGGAEQTRLAGVLKAFVDG